MKYLSFRFPNYILIIASVYLVTACSTQGTLTELSSHEKSDEPRYSIIYLIHGDADYLYHDSLGTARQADEEVLKEANRLGKQAENGEVLIFHQRPESRILWLFPQKDRHFIYYRNGKRIAEKSYSPSAKAEPGIFSAEADIYKEYVTDTDSIENSIFLYFGHEIPFKNGRGYYRSMADKKMNTGTFADGLTGLLPEARQRFDLAVLSTCNNATPDMVHALQPLSRYLLASPQNLHLSHIDTGGLSMLEENPGSDPRNVANHIAGESYSRLINTVQTVVSLSIFDMHEIDSYIHRADSAYRSYLKTSLKAGTESENIDCTDLSVFDSQIPFTEGVKSRYRPPLFGPNSNRKSHSGWGCKE